MCTPTETQRSALPIFSQKKKYISGYLVLANHWQVLTYISDHCIIKTYSKGPFTQTMFLQLKQNGQTNLHRKTMLKQNNVMQKCILCEQAQVSDLKHSSS